MKPILSVPETFYQYLKPAIREVSKPQGQHLTRYIVGLLASRSKTVDGITQSHVLASHQSSLNRFLTKSPWEVKQVRNALLRKARRERLLRPGCMFVLDDLIARKRGKHIDFAGWQYDHTEGKSVWGNQIVTSGWSTPCGFVPFSPDVYKKQEDCKPKEFLTKNERACRLLREAATLQPFSFLLIDTWYANEIVLGLCQKRRWQYVTQVKSNKCFTHNATRWNAQQYATQINDGNSYEVTIKEQRYRIHTLNVFMEGIGAQQLVCCKHYDQKKKEWGEWHFLLSNMSTADPETLLRLYLHRWDIECFHKVAKQDIGLSKYQMRKHRGIVTHLSLVFAAYLLVLLWIRNQEKEVPTMPEAIRKFRETCEQIVVRTTIEQAKLQGTEKALAQMAT